MIKNNTQWQIWLKDHLSLHNSNNLGETVIILKIASDDIRTWTVPDSQVAKQIIQIKNYVKQYLGELQKM